MHFLNRCFGNKVTYTKICKLICTPKFTSWCKDKFINYMQHKQAIKKTYPVLSRGATFTDGSWKYHSGSVYRLPNVLSVHSTCDLLGFFFGGPNDSLEFGRNGGWAFDTSECTWKVGDTSAIKLIYQPLSQPLGQIPISLINTGAKRLDRSRLCTHRKLISAIWMDFSKTSGRIHNTSTTRVFRGQALVKSIEALSSYV